MRNLTPLHAVIGGLAAASLLLAVAGCNKGGSDTGTPSATTSAGTQTADASHEASGPVGVFQANCAKCHKMGEVGGGRAPDLSHEGSDATHTASWIADQIKDPKSHNPQSRMPAFQGRMSDADIQSLADHLASLK